MNLNNVLYTFEHRLLPAMFYAVMSRKKIKTLAIMLMTMAVIGGCENTRPNTLFGGF